MSLPRPSRGEGQARELVHHIQQLWKERGLDVSDRIRLHVSGDAGLEAVVASHRDYIMAENLSTDLTACAGSHPEAKEIRIDALRARIALARASRWSRQGVLRASW